MKINIHLPFQVNSYYNFKYTCNVESIYKSKKINETFSSIYSLVKEYDENLNKFTYIVELKELYSTSSTIKIGLEFLLLHQMMFGKIKFIVENDLPTILLNYKELLTCWLTNRENIIMKYAHTHKKMIIGFDKLISNENLFKSRIFEAGVINLIFPNVSILNLNNRNDEYTNAYKIIPGIDVFVKRNLVKSDSIWLPNQSIKFRDLLSTCSISNKLLEKLKYPNSIIDETKEIDFESDSQFNFNFNKDLIRIDKKIFFKLKDYIQLSSTEELIFI